MPPHSRRDVFAAVLVMLLGLTAVASAGERVKRSGSIVSIADDGKTSLEHKRREERAGRP